jgi:hypothetical protein
MANFMDYVFDANNFAPDQGGQVVPAGRYNVAITNTQLNPTRDGKGMQFVLEYTITEGPHANNRVYDRFNILNDNPTTVRIANGNLSAVCYVTGIQHVNMKDGGIALRNARLQVDVTVRNSPEFGQQNDVRKRYDIMGNEPMAPGNRPMAPVPGPAPQPMAPQAAPVAAPAPATAPTAAPWGSQPQAGPAPAQGGPAWSPGGSTPQSAPAAPAQGAPWQQGAVPATGGMPAWGNKA